MIRIAIQGIRGSYSEQAAAAMLPGGELLECPDFTSAFSALDDGRADLAVLPIRNLIVGDITPVQTAMSTGRYRIHETRQQDIDHVLVGHAGAVIGDVNVVSSHPEALKQCGIYLSRNVGWEIENGTDTASCIRDVAECGDKRAAAIGSRRAAEIYGGVVLATDIADQPGNWTEFVLIGK
ncbi:MAG: prephenate dehydratase domain-containing protein [Pyrinomonadaceae bacterium]|nr:prephenate dehydratase domain-containing protein [Pyrinomonadaceae bacterium]